MKPTAIEPAIYNSIINKTAISARTNRMIGGDAPSKYLVTLEHAAGIQPWRMNEILASHCICAEVPTHRRFLGPLCRPRRNAAPTH